MRTIRVTDIDDIGAILDLVHDRYFELDKLSFDETEKRLAIPLAVITEYREKKRRSIFGYHWVNPIVEAELVIRNAMAYSIEDEAQIGEADINTISQEGDYVVVDCGVPVTIRVRVSSIYIECNLTDRVVGEVKRFSFRQGPATLTSP